MRTDHTLGPWTVDDSRVDVFEGPDEGMGNAIVEANGGLVSIAEVHNHAHGSTEHDEAECRANARLIAVAPDLLALVAEAESAWMDSPSRVEQAIALDKWAKRARAVMAKALGRRVLAHKRAVWRD